MKMKMLLFDSKGERWLLSLPFAYEKAAQTRELWLHFLHLGKDFFNAS